MHAAIPYLSQVLGQCDFGLLIILQSSGLLLACCCCGYHRLLPLPTTVWWRGGRAGGWWPTHRLTHSRHRQMTAAGSLRGGAHTTASTRTVPWNALVEQHVCAVRLLKRKIHELFRLLIVSLALQRIVKHESIKLPYFSHELIIVSVMGIAQWKNTKHASTTSVRSWKWH